MTKNLGSVVFYVFLTIFITIAYLYNNNKLLLLPKDKTSVKSNSMNTVFKEKNFSEIFVKKYGGQANEITSFEETEKWSGNYEYDDINYIDGKTSMIIESKKAKLAFIELAKSIDISKSGLINMFVYSANLENGNNIARLSLLLEGDSFHYQYEINDLKPGWNVIKMPKEDFVASKDLKNNIDQWDKIKKIRLELVSKPNTKTELTLDRLWSEKNDVYQNDLLSNVINQISLKNFKGKTYLNYSHFSNVDSVFNKIFSVTDFSYLVKIIPQRAGNFSISARTDLSTGYGYYLELGGIGSKEWKLYKIGHSSNGNTLTGVLKTGTMNYTLKENIPLWLKLITKSDKISCYYSLNGTSFIKLTEQVDNEIKSGGIGLASRGGSFLIESVLFTQ